MQQFDKMVSDFIKILKDLAREQIVSVEYFPNGKSYRIPMGVFFLDASYDPFNDDDDNDMSVYIDCEYTIQLGMMYMKCSIQDGAERDLITPVSVPLDKKKQNKLHREIISLVNMCSKRVIAQEISRTKYAISSALNNTITEKQFS